MEPQVNADSGQMRTCRVLFQVDIISLLFCEREKCDTCQFSTKKINCICESRVEGMHVVLTLKDREM